MRHAPTRDYTEDHELVTKAQAGDLDARNRLIEKHRGFIYSAVQAFTPKRMDASEFFADGVITFIRAIEHFDVSRGLSLLTLAYTAIRNDMIRHVCHSNLISIKCYGNGKPTQTQIGAADQARRIVHARDRAWMLSPPPPSGGRAREERDRDALRQEVVHVLGLLPEREREVLTARMQGRLLRDIAIEMSISYERVRQLKTAGLRRCRKMMGGVGGGTWDVGGGKKKRKRKAGAVAEERGAGTAGSNA